MRRLLIGVSLLASACLLLFLLARVWSTNPAAADNGFKLPWRSDQPSAHGTGKFKITSGWSNDPNCAHTDPFNIYAYDFDLPEGTPVVASKAGSVVYAGSNPSLGNLVIIDHRGGDGTFYAHLSSLSVSANQIVAQGQEVGKSGHTGNATGPHLHFQRNSGVSASRQGSPQPVYFDEYPGQQLFCNGIVTSQNTGAPPPPTTVSYEHFMTINPSEPGQARAGDWQFEYVAAFVFRTQQADTVALFRLYNSNTGEHFYTASSQERAAVLSNSVWHDEGVAAYVFPTGGSGRLPLYRFFQTAPPGKHFYTLDSSGEGAPNLAPEGIAAYVSDGSHEGAAPLFRWFNAVSGDHFYTLNFHEVGSATSGAFRLEGIAAWVSPTASASLVPLYRLIVAGSRFHFYTISADERQQVLAAGGTDEGVAAYVAPGPTDGWVPFYRFYRDTGDHLFTVCSGEDHSADAGSYRSEGIAAYVSARPRPGLVPLYRWYSNLTAQHQDLLNTGDPSLCPALVEAPSPTETPTATPTQPPDRTPTPTGTPTPAGTATPVSASTSTPTPARTPTPVGAATSTPIPSRTPTPTRTPTPQGAATPVGTATPALSTVKLSIADVTVPFGGGGTAVLQAIGQAPGIGAYTIDIVYDSAIVSATNCSAPSSGQCNANYGPNRVRVAGFSANGLSGTVTLVEVGFQAATTAEACSNLRIEVTQLADPSGNSLLFSSNDGRICFEHTGSVIGDVDCSGDVTSVDALYIVQYAAGLLTSLSCVGNADVNRDGYVNAIDATLILQYVAGLIPALPV